MQTIEALKVKQAKELEKAIRHETMRVAVRDAMGLADENFSAGYMHSYKSDCHVVLEADTLSDALLLAERANPLALVRVKGACLSFMPDCRATDADRERATVELITPYIYEIDGLRQYGDERQLVWYVEAAGYVVECRCKVKHDSDTRRYYQITFDKRGNARKERNEIINKSGHFPRVDRFWSSDDQPSSFILWSY